jgi:UDP-N-acetylglucosamine acyltransferase
MGSVISRNVPPYVLVSGHMAKPVGINVEGLKRRNFTEQQIKNIRQAYKTIYRSGLKIEEAIESISAIEQDQSEIDVMVAFLNDQEGGIIR